MAFSPAVLPSLPLILKIAFYCFSILIEGGIQSTVFGDPYANGFQIFIDCRSADFC